MVDDLLEKGFPERKTTTTTPPPSPQTEGVNASQIDAILTLIDADITAAFDLMDKLDWGNHKGRYNDKIAEFISPPVGFSKPQFREQLKLLFKSVFG